MSDDMRQKAEEFVKGAIHDHAGEMFIGHKEQQKIRGYLLSLLKREEPEPVAGVGRQGERGPFKVRERFERHLEMAAKVGAPPTHPEWSPAPAHLHAEIEEVLAADTSPQQEVSLRDAAEELLECADLRGDAYLPHPEDDPQFWSARMQTAWDELRVAVDTSPPDDQQGSLVRDHRAMEKLRRLGFNWAYCEKDSGAALVGENPSGKPPKTGNPADAINAVEENEKGAGL